MVHHKQQVGFSPQQSESLRSEEDPDLDSTADTQGYYYIIWVLSACLSHSLLLPQTLKVPSTTLIYSSDVLLHS